jgi:hypothetical protein
MITQQENRQHKRMDIALPLSYFYADHTPSKGAISRGITLNVSSGGAYFHPHLYDQHLSVNQVLNLTIESCREDHKGSLFPWVHVVSARCKILRIDKLAGSHGKLGVALQFIETPSVR